MEVATVEYVEPRLKPRVFHKTICEQDVFFKVLRFERGLFIWIGSSSAVMGDLAIAMLTPYEGAPLSTKVMGDIHAITSSSMAARLSKKFGKPVYVSFNADCDRITLSAVETCLMEEVNAFPEFF